MLTTDVFGQKLLLLLKIFSKELLAGYEFFNYTLQTGECPSFLTVRPFHDLKKFCRKPLRTAIFVNPALDFIPYLLKGFSRIVLDPMFDIPLSWGSLRFSRNWSHSSLFLSITAPGSRRSTRANSSISAWGNSLSGSRSRCFLSKNHHRKKE